MTMDIGFVLIALGVLIIFMYGEPIKSPNTLTKPERVGIVFTGIGFGFVLVKFIYDLLDWLL